MYGKYGIVDCGEKTANTITSIADKEKPMIYPDIVFLRASTESVLNNIPLFAPIALATEIWRILDFISVLRQINANIADSTR